MVKYLLLGLLVLVFVVLGCAGVLSSGNCDTTPVKSATAECADVIYPKNALDPCAPSGPSWEEVNTMQADNGLIFQFLKNTTPNAKITHVVGVFARQRLPLLVAYVEEGQIRALRLKPPCTYIWEPEMTDKLYQALTELFFIGFPKDCAPVIEPLKKRC